MKVNIYTWSFCPYCIKAKKLLDQHQIPYEEHEISGDQSALDALKAKTGMGSVPQIFVDETFIGGCDDLYDIYNHDQERFKTLFQL